MRHSTLYSTCVMVLLVWGCPKRQTGTRIVYVPAPPPESTTVGAASGETLTIEEPLPPEPVEVDSEGAPPPTPPRRRRVPRAEPQPAAVETEPEALEVAPPPAEVPALAPRESAQQHTALRRQILARHERLEQRMKQLEDRDLSAAARATLQDARTFLAQSRRAVEDGDLQRALNLAEKSQLLVSALE